MKEIQSGRKTSHWIWYIFPQLRHPVTSSRSHYYGLAKPDEAVKYLAEETLKRRLCEITKALLQHKDKSAVCILGDIDAMKVQSCMTLFDILSPNDIYGNVLDLSMAESVTDERYICWKGLAHCQVTDIRRNAP